MSARDKYAMTPKQLAAFRAGKVIGRDAALREAADWILEHPHPGDDPAKFYAGLVKALAEDTASSGESAQPADLHTVIHEALTTFQSRAHNGGYYQQLTAHLVEALAPLVPYRDVWDSGLPPGGLCCSICGQPVESEPCPDHTPLTPARPQLAGQQIAGAVLDEVTNGGGAE